MTDIDTFRTETRAWLEANYPPSLAQPMGSEDDMNWGGRKAVYKNPDTKLWLDRMAARGWTAPTWPKEYGGGGLSAPESRVLNQELGRIKARSALVSFGIWMLGPALLEYANEEQKKEHLPKIVRGEIRWCQGYSEPGAGSDLASLQTRCEDKGDHWLVNGQKIWTSYANYADWCFCLVRTDTTKKHEGISFMLIDMATPGVETRPIKLISGNSPVLRDLLHRREGAQGQPGRPAERRLGDRQAPPAVRAAEHFIGEVSAAARRRRNSTRSPRPMSARMTGGSPTPTCARASPGTGWRRGPSR